MSEPRKLTADNVATAIEQHHGIVAVAARAIGVTREALHRYIAAHPTAQAQLKAARETMTDMVEGSLYRAAAAGESWAVQFYLKTQGRGRGYGDHQDIAMSGGLVYDIRIPGVTEGEDDGE
jgi:hypothetical protein